MMDTVSETRHIGRTLKRIRSMEQIRPKRDSDVSTGNRDFSVFVELSYASSDKIKLIGEELKQLLKGHTFHLSRKGFEVRRRFESDLTDD
jgi:hypothetical protein